MMLRTDGLYRHTSIQSDGEKSYSYLRFYADGVVVCGSTNGEPEKIKAWFSKGSPLVSKGQVVKEGARLSFSVTSTFGAVDYEGEMDGNQLSLDFVSHINGNRGSMVFEFVEW